MIPFMKDFVLCKDTEYVLIHDGARPFIDNGIIERGLMAAAQTGASVVGMPSKDTVKIADAEGNVSETPDRSSVCLPVTAFSCKFAYSCFLFASLFAFICPAFCASAGMQGLFFIYRRLT
jgi:ispD: 2-C-methyl-D-erythritol 4-phosphate cytidylyltransferase